MKIQMKQKHESIGVHFRDQAFQKKSEINLPKTDMCAALNMLGFINYSKTCVKRPLSKILKIGHLMGKG